MERFDNDAFYSGVIFGISIYQRKVIDAHRKKEPLRINDELYYIQNGKEKLLETIDEICK